MQNLFSVFFIILCMFNISTANQSFLKGCLIEWETCLGTKSPCCGKMQCLNEGLDRSAAFTNFRCSYPSQAPAPARKTAKCINPGKNGSGAYCKAHKDCCYNLCHKENLCGGDFKPEGMD